MNFRNKEETTDNSLNTQKQMIHKETQTANIEQTEIMQIRKDFADLKR